MVVMQAFGKRPGGGGSRPVKDPVAYKRWTIGDTKLYRAEVERRFRERTPAKKVLDVDIGCRVNRSEMRSWAISTLGKELPELDREWGLAQVKWTKAMIRRVVKELDPDMYETVSKRLRQDAHMMK